MGLTSTTCSATGNPFRKSLAIILFPFTVSRISQSSRFSSFDMKKYSPFCGLSLSNSFVPAALEGALELVMFVIFLDDFILKSLRYVPLLPMNNMIQCKQCAI